MRPIKLGQRKPYVRVFCPGCVDQPVAGKRISNGQIDGACPLCGGPFQRVRGKIRRMVREGDKDGIPYPHRASEFEIQAYIFQRLSARFRKLESKAFSVRGEVQTRFGFARFDLVVFIHSEPWCIIEVKAEPGRRNRVAAGTSDKLHSYSRFGVRVHIVRGMNDARQFCALLVLPSPPPAPNLYEVGPSRPVFPRAATCRPPAPRK